MVHPVFSSVVRDQNWTPLKAHNGYIDLFADLGLLGLTLFIANSISAIRNSMKLAAIGGELYFRWPLVIVTIILAYNTFESELLGTFLWLLYVSITVSSRRILEETRSRHETQPMISSVRVSEAY